ncbi:MAG: glycosyltransferase family 9 protein [Candidatus Omnitrophota bacterium]
MKSRKKIILDRIIAKPFAFLLNLVVWPLRRVIALGRNDSPEKVKTIAIAKFLGMGSILRATPMVRALKQKYPQARYIFITTLKNKPLVERLGLFDIYLYINDKSLFILCVDVLSLIIKLWTYQIRLYFDLEVYSAFSTILSLLSLSRNRYGFYKDTTAFRAGLNTHLVYFNDTKPISRAYLQLTKACGIKYSDCKPETIKLQVFDKQELEAWLRLNNLNCGINYIVVNPNASDLLLERRWPKEYFIELINALVKVWDGYIFCVGSPQEAFYVATLCEGASIEARKRVFNVAGKISFGAVMVLIKNAQLVITNDSGLYHVAVSFRRRVISLWGPVNPAQYADSDNSQQAVFYNKEIYCSPCLHKADFPPCGGDNVCMKSIPPKEVYKKACQMLGAAAGLDTMQMDLVYQQKYSLKDEAQEINPI